MGMGYFAALRRGRAVALVAAVDDLGVTVDMGHDAHSSLAGKAGFPIWLWPRAGFTVAVAALFVWLLSQRVADFEMTAAIASIQRVPLASWAAAAVLTGIAFWAVGQYDVLVHRYFATGVPPSRARSAGISAIAISQVLGLGSVTGAILRWRMLPERSFWLATRITLAVALSFLAGWAIVTAGVVLAIGPASYAWPAAAVLTLGGIGTAAAVFRPLAPFRWPNLFTISGLVALTAIDMLAAASAFYIMVPADISLSFAMLLPAFLLAYGAGVLSGTPGGIGAFELALLALLPAQPSAPILAAVIAWRLIYFVVPALLGAGHAVRGPAGLADLDRAAPKGWRYCGLSTWTAGQDLRAMRIPAEVGLLAQGAHRMLTAADLPRGLAAQMVAQRGHVLVGMLDPVAAPQTIARAAAIDLVANAARASGTWPAFYKVSAQLAAAARAKGWRCARIAREGVVRTERYDVASASCAPLRRKLRRAQSAGVRVYCAAADTLPAAQMKAIAQHWAQQHGGERGFSMGRYSAPYLAKQRVYCAERGGILIAFATFHQGDIGVCGGSKAREWTLDLMRHGPDMPDGGMHALVHSAINDAKAQGVEQVSLAAVPEMAFHARTPKAAAHLLRALRMDTGQGLRQFKDSFAPDWQPRYLCAPHWAGMVVAAASIWRAVVFGETVYHIGAQIAPQPHNRFALLARFWQDRG